MSFEYELKINDLEYGGHSYPIQLLTCLKRAGVNHGQGVFYSCWDIELDRFKDHGFSIYRNGECEMDHVVVNKKTDYLKNATCRAVEVWKYHFKAYFKNKELSFEF